jgi:hypothetical protein
MSMAGFERHDDRVSNMEAPPTTGIFLDASGSAWANRPDVVIDKYMKQVDVSPDEYWRYRRLLDNRQWFEFDLFLEQLEKTADQDSLIRIKKAREVISRMNKTGD